LLRLGSRTRESPPRPCRQVQERRGSRLRLAEGRRSSSAQETTVEAADVRARYEERVTGAGLEHIEPIWGEPPAELVHEFVETGGRAVVTCVDLSLLDASWLGHTVDQRFVDEIAATVVDTCGENGEYQYSPPRRRGSTRRSRGRGFV